MVLIYLHTAHLHIICETEYLKCQLWLKFWNSKTFLNLRLENENRAEQLESLNEVTYAQYSAVAEI